MGVPIEDRQELFKPYFKSKNDKSRKTNSESYGLGLSISKQIANSLNGDLKLNENMVGGCQFILNF